MKVLDIKTGSVPMRIITDTEYDRLMDVTQENNALSHWASMLSWVNDTDNRYHLASDCAACRGYFSARYWNDYYALSQFVAAGFRPAFDLAADALPPDIQDGEAVIIGTLYMDGIPVRVPKYPVWDSDIADYISGAKLEMRPALENPAYQVTAIRVGNVLVADRNLLRNISYLDIEQALRSDEKLFCYPELRFYGEEDHESDLAFGEHEREWVSDDEDAYHANMGQFRIAFEVGGERYYCNVEAANMLEALGFFFKEHPHITYDMVVFHEAV